MHGIRNRLVGWLWAMVAMMAWGTGNALGQEAGASPTLKRIGGSGHVYLAYRENTVPFSYLLPGDGGPTGYAWEICLRVVGALEKHLGRELKVVPVVATPNGRLMMVRAGMADMECGATNNTVGRQELVAFSNSFFVSQVRGMVRTGSGISSLDDLSGKRIVTTSGTTADRLVKMASLQRNISIRQLMGRDHPESMSMLVAGEADVYVADDAILVGQRAAALEPGNYELLQDSLSIEPYGLVLPKGDMEFKRLVDEALAQMMQTGEMEKLYEKWFFQPIPPKQIVLDLPISSLIKSIFAEPNDRSGN